MMQPQPPPPGGQLPPMYPPLEGQQQGLPYPPAPQEQYPPPPGYAPQPQQPGYAPPPGGPGQQYQPPPGYDPNQEVTQQQPMMQMMGAAPGVPHGLEYLTQLDQLIVKQKIEGLEAIFGFESRNKYIIRNSMGQDVYKAKEESDCCMRMLCANARPFEMPITDNNGQTVILINRPLKWCMQAVEVESPPGNVIGSVKQRFSWCEALFDILDEQDNVVLKIQGPGLLACSCCGDVTFDVLTADGSTEVGKITKQWSGFVREAFTDADNFGISFPVDLDVKVKATLLGALFLIDFIYFEKNAND